MMEFKDLGGEILTAGWLEDVIKDFCLKSTDNSLRYPPGLRAWEEPLVGFSRGDDRYYKMFQGDIGPFYLTPEDIYKRSFPGDPAAGERITVISWILPQTAATREAHRLEKIYPSDNWARSRHYGEMFNEMLRRHVCAVLREHGINAVAPVRSPFWERTVSERYGLASNWSERHAAFVSGLGTFGLCDGLITPRGKAVRCGSVVAGLFIPPTPRPYEYHHEYCLHFSQGNCVKCMKRCPVGAITKDGHDKVKCHAYVRKMAGYVKETLGLDANACGLCQTGVPCESRIPAATW